MTQNIEGFAQSTLQKLAAVFEELFENGYEISAGVDLLQSTDTSPIDANSTRARLRKSTSRGCIWYVPGSEMEFIGGRAPLLIKCVLNPALLGGMDASKEEGELIRFVLGMIRNAGVKASWDGQFDSAIEISHMPVHPLDLINFQEDALSAFRLAAQQARRERLFTIGVECLLMGMLMQGGPAYNALVHLSVNFDSIRTAVRDQLWRGWQPLAKDPDASDELPFTCQMRGIFESAWQEAVNNGDELVDTSHLLVGVLNSPEGQGFLTTVLKSIDPNLELRALQSYAIHVMVTRQFQPRSPKD